MIGPHFTHDTQRESFPLPAGSLYAGRAPFKRSNVTQALIDGACVFFGLLTVFITAISIPMSMFILFFVAL
jgi:hypothetical protein